MTDVPENALRARQMYAGGVPVRAILAETKLTSWDLYNWIDGRANRNGEQLLEPLPKRRIIRAVRITPGDRNSVMTRMMRSIERQTAEIDSCIGVPGHDREKNSRVTLNLTRALRELTAVAALNGNVKGEPDKNTERERIEEDMPPDDIDEFRNELARRIDALVASRTDEGASGPSSASLAEKTLG
jgi:hypothetical protein